MDSGCSSAELSSDAGGHLHRAERKGAAIEAHRVVRRGAARCGVRGRALLSCALTVAASVSAIAQPPEPVEEIRVGYTEGVFSDVNRADAVASMKTWIEAIASQRGFRKTAVVKVFDSAAHLEEAVAAGELHVVIVQSHEYLEIEHTVALDPVYIPSRSESIPERIVLLVGANTPVTDLEGLRGTRLIAHDTAGTHLGRLWLERELAARNLQGIDEFFDLVELETNPSRVVLPVFFGRYAAAVISEKAFDVVSELNPQLRRNLTPLLRSPEVVSTVVCVWRGNWTYKQDLLDGLSELDETIQGRQILTVFKIDRLSPFDDAYLEPVRKLVGVAPGTELGGKRPSGLEPGG